MRRIHLGHSFLCSLAMIFSVGLPTAAHEADQPGPRTHKEVPAVITKIESGLIFLKPKTLEHETRPRVVSVKKAERMGLQKAVKGDEVLLTVDEGNVLLDIHTKGVPAAGHTLMVGKLTYADPFWEVIEVSTNEGTKTFAVDTLAGSKLSGLTQGSRVRVELDEDNIVIDIHPFH